VLLQTLTDYDRRERRFGGLSSKNSIGKID